MLGNPLSSGLEHNGKGGGDQGCARAVVRVLRCDGLGGKIPVRENNLRPRVGALGSTPSPGRCSPGAGKPPEGERGRQQREGPRGAGRRPRHVTRRALGGSGAVGRCGFAAGTR